MVGVAAAAGASAVVPTQVGGGGQLNSSPSDPRATFHAGNVTTCTQVGLAGSTQVGAPGNNSATDGNVTGTAGPNTGTIQPGQGEELNVTLNNAAVVIDAVVVHAGDAYNVYSNATVLPPTLPPPQHYIGPLNGGGNVPRLSHWFICYHLGTPPAPGSLLVSKVVVFPVFPPLSPLPVTF